MSIKISQHQKWFCVRLGGHRRVFRHIKAAARGCMTTNGLRRRLSYADANNRQELAVT